MYNTILTYAVLFLLCFGPPIGICESQKVETIHGQVVDKQNNPLSGYTVSAVSQTGGIIYAAKTKADGQFTLTDLHAGTWTVEVRHFSTLLAQREVTVADETELVGQGEQRQPRQTDFVIEGTGVILGFLLDAVSKRPLPITGKIQFGRLTPDDAWIERTYRGEISNGYFEVKDLLAGRYVIIDAFDSYVSAMANLPVVTIYPGGVVGGVEVFLKSGASLSGIFVDSENRQPIYGAVVRVASEKSERVYSDSTFAHKTETNENGEFRLTMPNDPEIYYAFTVIASHPRYQTHQWRREMVPGQNVYALGKLTLTPFLSLQGKVVATRRALSFDGLTVRLKMHNKAADFFRAAAQPEHTARPDASGNFLFSELHPVEYSLTISRNSVIIVYMESVNPQSRKPLKIRLPKLETLHGTVVDTEQRPIAGANLYTARRSEIPHGHGALLSKTQTDANGVFRMQVLETKPHLLSLEVSKKGYLSRVYQNVDIHKEPLIVPLQKGFMIKGRVILPREVSPDGYYIVNVFPEKAEMEPTLNPLALNRPLLSKRFPVTQPTFVLEGLFEEKYTLYIAGDGIATAGLKCQAATDSQEMLIVADNPTVGLKGQVLWADTGEPVQNALVSRSWYPWELTQYDMSLTLDRFETETDAKGQFTFSNLTQAPYQLRIRAVQSIFEKEADAYQHVYLQKQVAIPACSDNVHHIYIGKADGTAFGEKIKGRK